jgi:hypothetical protein
MPPSTRAISHQKSPCNSGEPRDIHRLWHTAETSMPDDKLLAVSSCHDRERQVQDGKRTIGAVLHGRRQRNAEIP